MQRNDLPKVDLYQITTTYQHLRQPVIVPADCVNTPFCCIAEGSGLNNPDNISLYNTTSCDPSDDRGVTAGFLEEFKNLSFGPGVNLAIGTGKKLGNGMGSQQLLLVT